MFILSYFRHRHSEALHLALSEDGLRWEPLNSDLPVLTGSVGTKTLRDPFLFQAQDGRFHLLATDGWNSDHIVHATSSDLVIWSEQRRLPVMVGVPGVRNAWAPECFWDRDRQVYQLIWSSSTGEGTAQSDWNHRIWGTTTTDFETFTPARLFFDPGHSVIDAAVAWHQGRYLLAYKDERGENRVGTTGKAIHICSSQVATGPWEHDTGPITPPLTEGPILFRRNGMWTLFFDHFMEGAFAGMESVDGTAWQPIESDRLQFPPRPNHGSVLEVSDSVAENLLRRLISE